VTAPQACPLFIVGSGRSGTTLLWRLLHSRPELALTNEAGVADLLKLCTDLAGVRAWSPLSVAHGEEVTLHGYIGEPYLDLAGQVVRRHAVRALEDFYREAFPGRHYRYFGDKLPDPETAIALQTVYPDLRTVVMVRDPRDVLCSIRSFAERSEVVTSNPFLATVTPHGLGTYWRNVYSGLLRYARNRFVLRYEDLVQAPVERALEILEWLEIATGAEDRMLIERAAAYTPHGTAPSAEASVGRWRDELADADVAAIEAVAGELMEELRYLGSDR
jgi:hypothetical protein